jgi:hypothetical protein
MISWIWWPLVAGDFHSGNLIMAILGAMLAIVLGTAVAYRRSLRGQKSI